MSEIPSYIPQEKVTPKELLLDMATLGLLAIGIRAYIDPTKYGDSPFIHNAVETARMRGFIDEDGIHLTPDLELVLGVDNPQTFT